MSQLKQTEARGVLEVQQLTLLNTAFWEAGDK
jgi:hypothetical protein